jgi:hypothetical protein
MAGMKFEYDENGGKFYYFLLSFCAMILVPATYYWWPEKKEKSKLTTTTRPKYYANILICLSVCVCVCVCVRVFEEGQSQKHPEDTSTYGPCRVKYQLLNANEPYKRKKQQIMYVHACSAHALLAKKRLVFSLFSLARLFSLAHGSYLP